MRLGLKNVFPVSFSLSGCGFPPACALASPAFYRQRGASFSTAPPVLIASTLQSFANPPFMGVGASRSSRESLPERKGTEILFADHSNLALVSASKTAVHSERFSFVCEAAKITIPAVKITGTTPAVAAAAAAAVPSAAPSAFPDLAPLSSTTAAGGTAAALFEPGCGVAPEPCLSFEAEEQERPGFTTNAPAAPGAAASTTSMLDIHDSVEDGAILPPVSVCGDSSVEDLDGNIIDEEAAALLLSDDIPETEFGEFLLDAVEWL